MEPILLGPNYEMTIHPKIVERLGLEPGWSCSQAVFDDHIEVRFRPPGPYGPSLAGILAPYIDPEVRKRLENLTEDEWHEEMDRAVAQGALEDWLEKEERMRTSLEPSTSEEES